MGGEERGIGSGNSSSSFKDSGSKGGGSSEMGGACVVLDVMPEEGGGLKDEKKKGSGEFQCRICHLESDLEIAEGSELIQLGCECKGELGAAHRHCAEAWFKLRGNRYCEICGILAKNITGTEDDSFLQDWNTNRMPINANHADERSCWKEQPFCKFLAVCLVVAFILPWFVRAIMF